MVNIFGSVRLRSDGWQRLGWLALWLAIQLLYLVEPARAAVTLTDFTAQALDGAVVLRWETASELDNAGFYIQRSEEQEGNYERIGSFIDSTGDVLIGAQYSYEDTDVTNEVTYWYKLEAIDLSQNSELHGPVFATPGLQPTDTTTMTVTVTVTGTLDATDSQATSTSTPTATSLVGSRSTPASTPSPTFTATQTPLGGLPTATRTLSAAYPGPSVTAALPAGITNTPDASVIADQASTPFTISTATLIPLPSITFILPETDVVAISMVSATGMPAVDEQSGNIGRWILQRARVIAVILIIWVVLGAWLVYALRNMT